VGKERQRSTLQRAVNTPSGRIHKSQYTGEGERYKEHGNRGTLSDPHARAFRRHSPRPPADKAPRRAVLPLRSRCARAHVRKQKATPNTKRRKEQFAAQCPPCRQTSGNRRSPLRPNQRSTLAITHERCDTVTLQRGGSGAFRSFAPRRETMSEKRPGPEGGAVRPATIAERQTAPALSSAPKEAGRTGRVEGEGRRTAPSACRTSINRLARRAVTN